jgi:hypothetical protein
MSLSTYPVLFRQLSDKANYRLIKWEPSGFQVFLNPPRDTNSLLISICAFNR